MKKFYFLIIMIFIYGILFFWFPSFFWNSFTFFLKTLFKIIPMFIFIFVLMSFVNKYVDNNFIIKHLRGNKIKSWFYIIIGGIISTGPMYTWYPILNNLKEKGVNNGEIASFLYNRSIKPAFFPMLIFYFGLKYTIVLTAVIILTSFIQAFIVEFLMSLSNDYFN